MYFHYMKKEEDGNYAPIDPKLIISEEEEYDAILVFPKDGDPVLITDGVFNEGLSITPVRSELISELTLTPAL